VNDHDDAETKDGQEAPELAPTGDESEAQARGAKRRRGLQVLLQLVLAAAIVAGAAFGASTLVNSAPTAGRQAVERGATLAEVVAVERTREQVTVEAAGTVMPWREVELRPRVQGAVIEVSPALERGGIVSEGQVLLNIDPADYELAIRQARSTLAQAQASKTLESGSKEVARREYALLGGTVGDEDPALVLREPQMAQATAVVSGARAQLDRAKLDKERTQIVAPFDAVVRTRGVSLGDLVGTTTTIASLVDTSTWWIEVLVPVAELRWLEIPSQPGEAASQVRVSDTAAWGPGIFRRGHVVRLAPDLEEQGRLARLLVAVDDPLSLSPANAGEPRLLLGAWVEVAIEGRTVDDVVALDRALLRDGGQVWVLTAEGALEVRDVVLAWAGTDSVLVSDGLASGDRVVSSALPAAVPGMRLRLADEAPARAEGGAQKAGPASAEADAGKSRGGP
jgi:RND family efflux transporter MFP subunit